MDVLEDHYNKLPRSWGLEVEREKQEPRTKFAKILHLRLNNFLIEFFAILDWKQNGIKFTDGPKIVGSQRCECNAGACG